MRRGGLFGKFVVSFVGLVVFVLVVNGAVETWFLYRETKTALVGVETERAVATALRIDQSLSDIERHISWVTRASVVALEQRRLDYAELLDQVPAIKELVQLDAAGHEQLRSRRDLRYQLNLEHPVITGRSADIPATPIAPAAYNWTGLYVGPQLGADWGYTNWTFLGTSNGNNKTYPRFAGVLPGGQAGYNYQYDRWVLGVEGDIAWTNAHGARPCRPKRRAS